MKSFLLPICLLSKHKHVVTLGTKGSSTSVPELHLRDNSFPYPPFETYKWKIFELGKETSEWNLVDKNVNIRTENGGSRHFVEEGGSSPIHVYFSFKKPGIFKICVDRLKEGYDDIVVETHEVEVEVVVTE